jgi:hypothetical protein
VTQEEIDKVKQEVRKQGIDLTQITIFYGGNDSAPSERGSFSPDGMPLASNGQPLSLDKITGFYYLGAE